MKFGILKSKIERKIEQSYLNNDFNRELKNFKKFVLENSEIRRAYHIYNELSTSKNFEKSFAEDFVNECIDLFGRIKFNKDSISLLENWVKDIKTENQYKDIDVVLEKNTLVIENIVQSKRRLVENLSLPKEKTDSPNVPIKRIYEIAKDNLKNYLSELNESDLNQINKYLTLSESEIQKRYDILSEMVIEKLEKMIPNSEKEISEKITETIEKIKKERVEPISLLKLKNLNESL